MSGSPEEPASPPAPVGDVDESTPFKLFVGQVPVPMTAEQLRPHFEPFGNIEEVTIIFDKTTHQSKGCGFVTFSTEESARAAIDALSDKLNLNGKPLVVKFAEGLRQRMEHKLYVANVPMEMGEEELTTIFAEHGEVKQLQLMRRPDDNASKGTALVRYSKRSEAIAAIAALNSTTLPGAPRPLSIKFAAEPRSADSPPAGPSGGKISNGGNRTPQNGHSGNGSGFHRGNGHLPYMGGMGMQAGGMGMPMGPMGYGMQGGGMPPPLPGTGFKLFVGMIPYSTGEAELQSVFSQFGPLVEVFMMREKDGRSKGCAFVRFYTKEAANAACMALNGTMLLPGAARNLVVKFAEPSEPRSNRGAATMGGGMRYVPDGMGGMAMAAHMGGSAHMGGPSGGFMPQGSLGSDASQWMMAGQRPMMSHGGHSGGMQMVGGPMVGMAMVPPFQPQMGMPPMMNHYGQPGMEGLAMMHQAMSQYAVGQGGAQVAQYGYPPQGGGMVDPSQQQAPGGGWGGENGGGPPFASHDSQPPLSVNDYAQRGAEQALNGFGGMGGGMSSGMGGCMGGGQQSMGMLERQMSNTMISGEEGFGVGQSYDKLYVSNLPRTFSEIDVQRLFAPYGMLTEVMAHKRADGVPKGNFFVSFANSADGQQAARALHNQILPGGIKPITVRLSTSRRRDSRGGAGATGGAFSAAPGGGANGTGEYDGNGEYNGNGEYGGNGLPPIDYATMVDGAPPSLASASEVAEVSAAS